MNWDDLRVFLAVSRSSSLATAAQKLGIDATTVGRRLGRLAQTLDSTLFEAGPKGQQLTAHGQRLLAYAESIEKSAIAARSDLTGERGLLAGTVRVSVAEGLGTWLLARHLPAFHAANPAISVELVATNGFLNPSKREADLAIMLARPSRGPLIARQLTEYRLKLYASRAYARRHRLPEHTRDLKEHTLIGYIPDFIYAEELRYLEEIEEGLQPVLASSSINIQHGLAHSGAGICMLPCFIGDQDSSLVRVLDGDVEINRNFWLVVHKDVRRLGRVMAFIDWLSELVEHQSHRLRGI